MTQDAVSARRTLKSLLAVALLFAVEPVALAGKSRSFTIAYRGAVGCPSEADLVRQVQSRVPEAVRAAAPPSDVDARVELSATQDSVHGVVEISGPDGRIHRELTGADCEQLSRAISLIIALAIDPDADRSAVIEEPKRPPAPEPKPRATPAPAARTPATSPARFWLGAGFVAGLTGGVGPSPTPYQGLFAEAGRRSGSALTPVVRVAGFYARDSFETEGGGAQFSWLSLRASACPRLGARFFAEACLSFDYGRLRGRGYATGLPRSEDARWLGPGASLRAGAILFDVSSVSLELGGVMPMARDRFFFGPDETIYRIPAIAGYAALALGLQL